MRASRALNLLAALTTLAIVPAVVGVAAGAAGSAVTVGETAEPGDAVTDCQGNTLWVQSTTAGGASYVAPNDGVVVSWSVYSVTGDGVLQLKLAREGAGNAFTIQTTTPRKRLAAGLNTFATRLPIRAGDTPALFLPDITNFAACRFSSGVGGDVVRWAALSTEPLDGSNVTAGTTEGSTRLDLSLKVEPDVDHDGFGDVTQDACPSRADHQSDCAAPDTGFGKVKKRITTKAKRVRVTLPLTSTETGATFTCSVDGKTPQACTSPFRPRLGAGKHVVYVTSTDAAGNTDATAATMRLKVVRTT